MEAFGRGRVWGVGEGKDENIGNHRYIDTSILRIYRRYFSGYLGKNIGRLKIVKNSWKCKENLIII